MSLMIDRMQMYGVYGYNGTHTPLVNDKQPDHIIRIDNVAKYYLDDLEHHIGEKWDMQKDFPNLAPPFSDFWMEYKQHISDGVPPHEKPPKHLDPTICMGASFNSFDLREIADQKLGGTENWTVFQKVSCLLFEKHLNQSIHEDVEGNYSIAYKKWDAWRKAIGLQSQVLTSPFDLGEMYTISVTAAAALYAVYPVRWITIVTTFIEKPDGKTYPVGLYLWAINEQGLIMEGSGIYGLLFNQYVLNQIYPGKSLEWCVDELRQTCFPFFLAISFMHCKNVVTTVNEPPAKLSKAYQKRRGVPLVKYYTLEIEPMKQVLRREGQSEKTGLKRALHICRGHFAHYSPDKPLFGRVSGTFWKPAHVRGSLSEGAVIKDYEVKEPTRI